MLIIVIEGFLSPHNWHTE